MAERGLKEMAGDRSPKIGHFIVEFVSPGIGHIVKSAGCDFVLFDMEHSGFSFETVKSGLRYFEAAGVPAVVRVPSQAYNHIARGMDVGVEGLMIPMVGTAAQVRHILDSMKYHPLGRRGVALQIAHDNYRPGSVAEKFTAANQRTAFFCLIETAEGVENVEEIAAIDGVDCIWVGHFDLSVSLGIPGQFDDSAFTGAMDRIIAAARASGKALGRLVSTVEQGIAARQQGFDFVCYSGDVWVLHDALAAAVGKLREGFAAGNQSESKLAAKPAGKSAVKKGSKHG